MCIRDRDITRRLVMEFYDKRRSPTAEKIRQKIIKRFSFSGSVTSVRRISKSYRVSFTKMNDRRTHLLERFDRHIAQVRVTFYVKCTYLKTRMMRH